jgi:hypothetical protein
VLEPATGLAGVPVERATQVTSKEQNRSRNTPIAGSEGTPDSFVGVCSSVEALSSLCSKIGSLLLRTQSVTSERRTAAKSGCLSLAPFSASAKLKSESLTRSMGLAHVGTRFAALRNNTTEVRNETMLLTIPGETRKAEPAEKDH